MVYVAFLKRGDLTGGKIPRIPELFRKLLEFECRPQPFVTCGFFLLNTASVVRHVDLLPAIFNGSFNPSSHISRVKSVGWLHEAMNQTPMKLAKKCLRKSRCMSRLYV